VIFLWLAVQLTSCTIEGQLASPTIDQQIPQATAIPASTQPPSPGTVAGFRYFLLTSTSLKADQRQGTVNRYMAQISNVPITGEKEVVFLWQGAADSVSIIGDMNGWDTDSALVLTRIDGTDLWFIERNFDNEARLEYRFVINETNQLLDPLNRDTYMSETGPNSVLKMPGYEASAELTISTIDIPSGTATTHKLDSNHLGQTRTFIVYEPAGQLIGQKLPTLYLNYGGNYLNLIDAPSLLDTLIATREIPPIVVVFIPAVSALEDYGLRDTYNSFLAEELVPFIQDEYHTDPDPTSTGIMGPKLGGLAALYTAINRPDVFGLAAGQSTVFTEEWGGLIGSTGGVQRNPVLGETPDIFLVVGSYETNVEVNGLRRDLLAANRQLTNILIAAGYSVHFEEVPEGHSWGSWRGTFGEALGFLYSQDSR
jgi:enterochelin esterase family protein